MSKYDYLNKRHLASLGNNFVPGFILENYPKFYSVVESFLENLDYEDFTKSGIADRFGAYALVRRLYKLIDIDETEEEFLELFVEQYLFSVSQDLLQIMNVPLLIKKSKEFFSSKGKKAAFEFLFRIVDSAIVLTEPQPQIMKLSVYDHNLSGIPQYTGPYVFAGYWLETSTILILDDASSFSIGGDISSSGTGIGTVIAKDGNNILIDIISGSFNTSEEVDNANPFVAGEATINSIDTGPYAIDPTVYRTDAYLDKKIHDNTYYSEYVYAIQTEIDPQLTRELLTKFLHPIGMSLFIDFNGVSLGTGPGGEIVWGTETGFNTSIVYNYGDLATDLPVVPSIEIQIFQDLTLLFDTVASINVQLDPYPLQLMQEWEKSSPHVGISIKDATVENNSGRFDIVFKNDSLNPNDWARTIYKYIEGEWIIPQVDMLVPYQGAGNDRGIGFLLSWISPDYYYLITISKVTSSTNDYMIVKLIKRDGAVNTTLASYTTLIEFEPRLFFRVEQIGLQFNAYIQGVGSNSSELVVKMDDASSFSVGQNIESDVGTTATIEMIDSENNVLHLSTIIGSINVGDSFDNQIPYVASEAIVIALDNNVESKILDYYDADGWNEGEDGISIEGSYNEQGIIYNFNSEMTIENNLWPYVM